MSAFRSAARVARYEFGPLDWVLGDIFVNQSKIHAVKAPVLIVHGRHDEIVTFDHGEVRGPCRQTRRDRCARLNTPT